MPAEPVIDVERLLQPISEGEPCGNELEKWNERFARVKEAFDEAMKLVNEEMEKLQNDGLDGQGQPWRTIPPPDWKTVIDLCVEVLESESKDFRLASWLTIALLHTNNLVGLRDGLQLCAGLCERYWECIHPAPTDEDGHTVTVGGFNKLDSKGNHIAVLRCPVVYGMKRSEREAKAYSSWDYQRAMELEGISDAEERQRKLNAGQIELSEFRLVATATPAEFFETTIEGVEQCIELLKQLGTFFHENCKPDEHDRDTAPGFSEFLMKLEEVRRLARELGGKTAESAVELEVPGETDDSDGSAVPDSSEHYVIRQGQEMTRESAFQTIESIAHFFERTEPHTPVHFALRQAVRWGRAPLPELMAELIDDVSVMEKLRRQIGMPPVEAEKYD